VDPVSTDAYVARFDPQGNFQWVNKTSGATAELGAYVAIAQNGDCIASGIYQAASTWDGLQLPYEGGDDLFVVRLAAADGAIDWGRSMNGVGQDSAIGLDIDGNDRIAFAATFEGTSTIADRSLTSDGAADAYVLLLDGRGNTLSLLQLGGSGAVTPFKGGLAFDPSSTHLALAFEFDGELVVHDQTSMANSASAEAAVYVAPAR
jgi:hypothetical protein